MFLQLHPTPQEEIVLDLNASDNPLHGHQPGRFFHGYYQNYCFLPLYIFVVITCFARAFGRRTLMPAWEPLNSSIASCVTFEVIGRTCGF